ncbi:phage baseplate assembly protein [Bradyrhizobium sp. S3.7.6]
MPKPQEVCTVKANGVNYNIWETVEVTRTIDDRTVDHCLLTVAESSKLPLKLDDIKLMPGDPVTVSLAGQQVINGTVYLRQVAYDGHNHAVQIGISSKVQDLVASTVDAKPGQHINQNVQQMGSAVAGAVGVSFRIDGNPPGANKIFKRFSEHIGETRFACIDRMCRMVNLHLMDNGGELVAFRGPARSTGLTLEEGRNILRARVVLSNRDHADNVTALANDFNDDSGDKNREPKASSTVTQTGGRLYVSPYKRNVTIACEEPTDQEGCQHRANHEADWIKFENVDGDITTQGWLTPNGDLWFNHLRSTIVVKSPMLVPSGSFGFMIKGIIHRQSSYGGTTTDVLLCRVDGKGTNTDVVTPFSGDAPAGH